MGEGARTERRRGDRAAGERGRLDEIRYAVAEDIGEVADLWCEAFPGKRTPAERARMLETGGPYGGLESVLVARDDAAALTGACKLYRLTQHIAGVAMPIMGLAAVAVAPAARRRGLGARLCGQAVAAARERGDVLSTLYPFRPDYYERLGWGLVGELHDHRFRTADLPRYDEARHVRAARLPADTESIAACYARVAARSNGPIRRDERIWSWRLAGEDLGVREVEDGARARCRAIVHDDDGITGYALLRARHATGPDRPSLRVLELVAGSEDAYRGLLGWLARQAGRWPVARHTARPEERFGDRLRDPRPPGARPARSLYFPTARIIRGPMLRLLDVPRALALRRYFDAAPDRAPARALLEIRMVDPQVPASQDPWLVRIEEGGARIVESGAADARLEADATTLARIYAGELAPADAARAGRAVARGDLALLNAAFATRERFWLLDEF